jgi:hypothetical protein
MSNDDLKKNQFLINNLQKRPNLIRPGSLDKDYHVGRQSWKNDKVKFPTKKNLKLSNMLWKQNERK